MKVRCIDAGCSFLTKNKIYEVIRKTEDGFYEIIDDAYHHQHFFQSRFEEVKKGDTVMKVRCIDPGLMCLTKNKIYEVLEKDSIYYTIIDDNRGKSCCLKWRFKEMTYNEILMDFCTKKNNLVNNALAERKIDGVYYMVKEDFDEVKSWDEEICEKILEKLDLDDTDLCPWCLKRDIEETEKPGCLICNYGKRHGNCVYDSKSTYRIIRNNFSFSSVKGMEKLLNQTEEQYKLLAEQEKYTEKPNPTEMEPLKTYVVEFKYNNSSITRRICMYFGKCFGKKSVLWLREWNGFDYVGEGDNKFSWDYGKITKVIADVTKMLYKYSIEDIEREYGCEGY